MSQVTKTLHGRLDASFRWPHCTRGRVVLPASHAGSLADRDSDPRGRRDHG
jgi:hypothetical protein